MQTEIRKASFGLVFLSGVLLFVAFALVAWLWFQFSTKADAYDANRDQERLKKLAEYRKGEADKLENLGWVDQGKGIAKVPIGQAIRGVLPELKAKPVKASAVKVEEPYPYGLAAPKPAQPASAANPKSAETVPGATPKPGGSSAANQSANGTTNEPAAKPEARPATVDSKAPAPDAAPYPKATPPPAGSSTPVEGPTPSPSGKAGLPAGEPAAPTPSPATTQPGAPAPSQP